MSTSGFREHGGDGAPRGPWHAPVLSVLAFRETATGAVVTSEGAQSSGQAATQPAPPTPPITTPPQKQANLCDGATMPGLTPQPFTLGTTGHSKPGVHTESHLTGCTPAQMST